MQNKLGGIVTLGQNVTDVIKSKIFKLLFKGSYQVNLPLQVGDGEVHLPSTQVATLRPARKTEHYYITLQLSTYLTSNLPCSWNP